jgi:hypothetical protein
MGYDPTACNIELSMLAAGEVTIGLVGALPHEAQAASPVHNHTVFTAAKRKSVSRPVQGPRNMVDGGLLVLFMLFGYLFTLPCCRCEECGDYYRNSNTQQLSGCGVLVLRGALPVCVHQNCVRL